MLNNYLKIIFRSFLKQKLLSIINIFSLTIGLSCSALIYIYILDEISFDKFNVDMNQLHRVVQRQNNVDGSLAYNGLSHSMGMGPALKEEIPGVLDYYRFFIPFGEDFQYVDNGNSVFKENIMFADFSLFDGFTFPLISGTVKNAGTHSAVLSKTLAKRR